VNAYWVKAWRGSMDGRISAAAPLTLADQLPLLMIVKRG